MTEARSLILISERPEDGKFFEPMARYLKMQFVRAVQFDEIVEALIQRSGAIVLWDLDHPGALEAKHPLNFKVVQSALLESSDPARVFALTDKTVNKYEELFARLTASRRLFHHNLLRRYDVAAFKAMARLLLKSTQPLPRGIAEYFPEGARTQKITLRKAEHRFAAVGAIESFIKKLSGDDRIASKVAQATDELLMNAIFDAATDRDGKRTRTLLDRKARFDFAAREQVELEFAATEEYLGVCVTDYFGSLAVDSVLNATGQSFFGQDYKPRKIGPGAGLGIYGIVESGLSLVYCCEPRKRTDSLVLFPRTKSYKAFKAGFRFTATFLADTKRSLA